MFDFLKSIGLNIKYQAFNAFANLTCSLIKFLMISTPITLPVLQTLLTLADRKFFNEINLPTPAEQWTKIGASPPFLI